METAVRPRSRVTVNIRCEECGGIDNITDRQYRRKKQIGRPHICRMCRSVQSRKPSEADLNYWLDRFTMEEIKEIAAMIWG